MLEPNGATYKTRDEDFLVSDSPDFHPTDVVEDADGSLLIVDTGGWYKVCCPTSQLAKPDVAGAIYRVRKTGAPRVEDPRGLKLDWAKLDAPALAGLLGDPRPAVVARATERLAQLGADAVPALEAQLKTSAPHVRQAVLWTLARISTPAARAAVRSALRDQPTEVRQTAAKIVALTRDGEARRRVTRAAPVRLAPPAPRGGGGPRPARRRRGRARPHLSRFAYLDRFLEHAVLYGLIDIGKPEPTRESLNAFRDTEERRAALIALSEMSATALPAATALSILEGEKVARLPGEVPVRFQDPRLRETVMWIAGRHPEWAPDLADYFRNALSANRLEWQKAMINPGIISVSFYQNQLKLETLFASLLREPRLQAEVTAMLQGHRDEQQSALRIIRAAELKAMPPEWIDQLDRLLRTEPALLSLTLPAANSAVVTKDGARLAAPLLEAAHSAPAPAQQLQALSALPAGAWTADEPLFALLRDCFAPERKPEDRMTAATALARAKLSDEQRAALTELLPKLGLMELTRLLPAFNRPLAEPLARQLIAALEKAPALASCPPQTLREIFAKQPASVQPQCDALLARLNLDTAQQRAKLDAIAAELPTGDVRRGQAVFAKSACIVCHRMGYLGGNFGPDLSSIGNARSERDLLEAIVFPSASFVRSYEPMTVKLKAGGELIGILRSETSDAVVVATAPGVEQRLARAEVADLQPGAVSLMPQGFDQVLSRQDLSDLVTFLKGAPPKKP